MDERTEGESTLESFWTTPERKAALRVLQGTYGLSLTEIFCFRREVREIPYNQRLPEALTVFISALANDTRDYFMQNCPEARWNIARKQFASVLDDTKRKRRHEELRQRARIEADEIRRDNARSNVLSFPSHGKARA